MDKIYVPPIKAQGIKTKLVPWIKSVAEFDDETVWVEPFMGTGVVGFNMAPVKALFFDSNPHVINLYNGIKNGKLTSKIVRSFLEEEGALLYEKDDEHYYEIRERFNKEHNPLDFLFLNRSCFNGMIRFNKKFEFNVPYCHKPNRFAKSYVTKIVNQVAHVERLLKENDWTFECASFEKGLDVITKKNIKNAFIYCDPPYIGRHVDYYDSWDEEKELLLRKSLNKTNAKFILSTWDENAYRKNEYIEKVWYNCYKTNKEHFYFIGGKEKNRNSMKEALIMNYIPQNVPVTKIEQIKEC